MTSGRGCATGYAEDLTTPSNDGVPHTPHDEDVNTWRWASARGPGAAGASRTSTTLYVRCPSWSTPER